MHKKEEWNGLREDTHKTFTINASNAGAILTFCVAIPAVLFFWSREVERKHQLNGTAVYSAPRKAAKDSA